MRLLVPVVIACASLLAGCGSIGAPTIPAAGMGAPQATSSDNAAATTKDPPMKAPVGSRVIVDALSGRPMLVPPANLP